METSQPTVNVPSLFVDNYCPLAFFIQAETKRGTVPLEDLFGRAYIGSSLPPARVGTLATPLVSLSPSIVLPLFFLFRPSLGGGFLRVACRCCWHWCGTQYSSCLIFGCQAPSYLLLLFWVQQHNNLFSALTLPLDLVCYRRIWTGMRTSTCSTSCCW
jgi:hypothetical protein